MQYVNDDMDDLFRSAAENYHLPVKGADWSKIAMALDNRDEAIPAYKKSDWKQLVWILCLMPVLVCTRPFTGKVDHAPETSSSTTNAIAVQPVKKHPIVDEPAFMEMPITIGPVIPGLKNATARTPVSFTPAKKLAGNETSFIENNELPSPVKAGQEIFLQQEVSTPPEKVTTADPVTAPVNKVPVTTVPVDGTKEAPVEKPAITLTSRSAKKFYAVLLGGLDVSTVRLQKVEHAGHHYGGLLGYRINKRWSVEAGFMADKKYYYTDGDYFDTRRVYMPANSKITEVNGDCNMFEIPVTVRYQFTANKRSSWSAAAGLSSYLMKKEHYDYLYYYGNSGTQAYHEKTYTNQSKNMFSILQLSAGYTHQVSKGVSIRLEPYLKLPVAGIGYGKLPLLSTGINVGIVKELF